MQAHLIRMHLVELGYLVDRLFAFHRLKGDLGLNICCEASSLSFHLGLCRLSIQLSHLSSFWGPLHWSIKNINRDKAIVQESPLLFCLAFLEDGNCKKIC